MVTRMKIYKTEYGWSTSAHGKAKDGSKIECYLEANFKRDHEPLEKEIEGELIFKEKNGKEWRVFPSSFIKKGNPVPKIVLLPMDDKPVQYQQTLTTDGRDMMGHIDNSVVVNPDELPFY